MLSKKKNKIYIVKKSKIFRLQAIDQRSHLIFLDDNNSINKVGIGKMDYYLGVYGY